jgi:hypothetical protein
VDSHKSVGRALHHNFQLAVILGAKRYAAGHHETRAELLDKSRSCSRYGESYEWVIFDFDSGFLEYEVKV